MNEPQDQQQNMSIKTKLGLKVQNYKWCLLMITDDKWCLLMLTIK